jgi:P4 family phage/plasmid primase-like protien
MIQIIELRKWTPPNATEEVTYFKPYHGLKYESLKECFSNIENDLKQFPKHEHFNLFYTVAHHLDGKRTIDSWQGQDIIPFDLDGIDLNRIDEYPPIVAKVCEFDLEKCAIVYSGNGCHVLVEVPLIKDKNFIKDNKAGYKALLKRIEKECQENDLPFTIDTTAWDYARILRLPFTENHKFDKQGNKIVKQARLIKNNLEAQELKLPVVQKEQKSKSLKKGSFPMPDKKTILKECNFFKWLTEKPDEVHEPHAYAMLSISGYFEDDGEFQKLMWSKFNSPSINSKDLDEFSEQALRASGPRTCEGIEDIFDGCKTCPHYKKVTSPILLKDEKFIGTEKCGFTTINFTRSGKSLVRHYEDLRKYYSREHKYIHIPEIKRLMVYKEGMYFKTYDDEVKAFAQKNFKPVVEKEEIRKQFLYQVKASYEEQKPLGFIHGAKNEGLINLKNGVLDIRSKTLLKHSHEYGFIYKLPYDYEPNAKCPTWELLLDNLTCGRQELKDLIEEAIAFTVGNVPYSKFQHYFLLTGSGSNGKSTFINIFKMILGSENTASIKLANLLQKEYYIAELEGKLANMVADEDPEAFEKKGGDSSLLKALTGGDTVAARVIYESPMQFVNRAKFFYAFNDIPKIGIKSHGDLRRPIIIPFDANLDINRDLRIDDVYEKIRPELSGILNRIVVAYERLIEKGFTKTSLTYENLKKSRLEHNPVYDFLMSECEVVDEKSFISFKELFNHFDNDSMYQNKAYPFTNRGFAKRVKEVLASEENFKNTKAGEKKLNGTAQKGVFGLRVIVPAKF